MSAAQQQAEDDEVVVFAEPPPADLKCSICLELFTDPLITACGHTFCSRCLFDIQSTSAACAVCREPVDMDELSPNLLAKSLVGEQRVHCRYGCTWTDEVGWVVDADNGCEEILQLGSREAHEVDCEYQPVLCPVAPDLCEVMYKWELEEHLEECPYARPDAIKQAKVEERRRKRTDVYSLFTYLTVWVFMVYFLYSSHTFGHKMREAGAVFGLLFSLPITFILALGIYEAQVGIEE
jgi:hypothetical protein